jgi:phage tail sheath protein FI
MTSPYYGVIFNQQDTDPLPPAFSDLSVLGIVLPSDDANAGMFPLNTPVDINTGDPTVLAAVGTGPLAKYINLINNQLGDLEVSARAVVVRVADNTDIDVVIANILGDPNAGTGLYALLKAGQMLSVIPRLIGAPGYTGKFNRVAGSTPPTVTTASKAGMIGGGALTLASPAYLTGALAGTYKIACIGGATSAASAAKAGIVGDGSLGSLTSDADAPVGIWRVVCHVAATNGGTFVVIRPDGTVDGVATVGAAYNSAHGPNFTLAHSGTDFAVGDEFDVTVAASVPTGGGVFSVTAPNSAPLANATVGAAYATQIAFTIAASGADFAIGDEFDVTVAITGGIAEANPICAALPAICEALMAHAVVGGPSTNKQDAFDWRATMNSLRLIPVDNTVIVADGVGTDTLDHAGAVLGLGVRCDFQTGGVPSHSFANQPVQGIIGLGRYDSFSIVDGATDGQELLAAGIGIIERGEIGSETAVGPSGFVSVALNNAGSDPLWPFYNQYRTRDYTHLALLRSMRLRLGKNNITPHSVQAVMNDMVAVLNVLKASEATIGFTVGFEASVNSPENLRLGRFRVFFKSEEPAPIVQVTVDSRRDRDALVVELAAIVAEASSLIAQTGTSAG